MDENTNDLEQAAEQSQNAGEQAAEQPQNAGEQAAEQPQNAGEQAAEQSQNVGEQAAEQPQNAGEQAAEQPQNAGEQIPPMNGNGQQVPPVYQNMGPASQPQPPKKKGTTAAIVIVCACILVLAVAAVVVAANLFSSPKSKVMKAVGVTMADADRTLAEYLGMEKMALRTATGQYSSELELILEGIEDNASGDDYSAFSGAGLRAQNSMDYDARQSRSDIQLVYNGSNLVEMNVIADDSEIGIALPDFFDGSLAFNTETFVEDYNNSYWRQAIYGEPLAEEVGVNLFDVTEASDKNAFKTQYAQDLKNAADVIEVVKTEKASIVVDDRELSCQGYEVTVPQVAIQVVVDDFFDYLKNTTTNTEEDMTELHDTVLSLIDKDLVYTVYLDKKGRMVSLECAYDFTQEEHTLSCAANLIWAGKEHMWDRFLGTLEMTDGESAETIDIKADYAVTKESSETRNKLNVSICPRGMEDEAIFFEYKASLDTDSGDTKLKTSFGIEEQEMLGLSLEGAFRDVKAGQQYRFDMDALSLAVQESSVVVTMSGSYAIGDLKDGLNTDLGTKHYVLQMDEEEFNKLGDEISGNMMTSPLMSLLMGM